MYEIAAVSFFVKAMPCWSAGKLLFFKFFLLTYEIIKYEMLLLGEE